MSTKSRPIQLSLTHYEYTVLDNALDVPKDLGGSHRSGAYAKAMKRLRAEFEKSNPDAREPILVMLLHTTTFENTVLTALIAGRLAAKQKVGGSPADIATLISLLVKVSIETVAKQAFDLG